MYKVLIVEDEVLVRVGLKSTLAQEGPDFMVVGEASNGLDGWDLYRRLKPDIVIADIKMPKQDGIWLTKQIRQEDSRTRILILTSYSDFDYVREAFQSGADNFILKSEVEDEELITALERLTEGLKPSEERDYASLQKYLELNSAALKESLYDEITSPDFVLSDGFHERCAHLRFDSASLAYTIAVFHRDGGAALEYGKRGPDTINNAVANLAVDILETEQVPHLLKEQDQSFELLLSSSNLSTQQLLKLLQSIRSAARSYFNVDFSAIYSRSFSDLTAAQQVRQEVEQTLPELFYCQSSTILLAESPRGVYDLNVFAESKELRQNILTAVHEASGEKCTFHLQKLELFLAQNRISPIHVRLLFSNIVTALLERYGESLGLGEEFTHVSQRIMNCLRLRQIVEIMEEFVQQLVDLISGYRLRSLRHNVEKAIEYIHEHYCERIYLDDLANHVNLSKHYLCYLFKKETGTTITNYINDLRIEKAKQLLLDGEYAVKELYHRLGFRDQQYFSKTFKRIVGKTVTEYKRQALRRAKANH
ncbi:MAG: response regulator [Firmicutes bacterium]|jgi:two-component system response regulator YesN|nr:response regulator [Bacillota bacterium]